MPRALFLLPAWDVFGRQRLSEPLARALGRADASHLDPPGGDAQLARRFETLPRRAAAAALTRQVDAGDAAGAQWLRVDPAHVRPDMNGARLLGIGERLGLSQADVDALLPALKPVFGDAGFALDAPHPARWYLRIPPGATLPDFSAPDDALGEDLFEHQVQGADARRWRALLNEVQIVLHNHPWNARRLANGQVPVNALWPWGGGALPDRVRSDVAICFSDDDLPRALARLAGGKAAALPDGFSTKLLAASPAASSTDAGAQAALFDLRRARDLAALQRDWLQPTLDALAQGALDAIVIDAADGRVFRLSRAQRWRFWRRPWSAAIA